MSFLSIFNPLVRSYFDGNGGGADELIVALATKTKYSLKSDAVTSVADNAFVHDGVLRSIDFPNVVSVGLNAFYGCSGLADVNLPKVATIAEDAFSLCALKEANFPIATQIGISAFSACTSLTEVNFPKVWFVMAGAFSSCSSLSKVSIPLAHVIDERAFADCRNLTTINCPAVMTIGAHAFDGCGCEKLDFHMVTTIGEGAFAGCSNLSAVVVRTTSQVCSVDLSALNGTPAMSGQGFVYVPASMYEAYRETYEPTTGAMFSAIFRKIEDYPEICG